MIASGKSWQKSTPVDEPDLFVLFVHPLHRAGLRYMITGSVASMHYGEPRLTMDVVLVIHLETAETPIIATLFPDPDYYTPPPDVISQEVRRATGGHFNVIHVPTGLKADFYPSQQKPTWAWAWEHRRTVIIVGEPANFAPPEYEIVAKLEFYREGGSDKHLRDIRGMLAVSGDEIDRALIETAVADLGLGEQWKKALTP